MCSGSAAVASAVRSRTQAVVSSSTDAFARERRQYPLAREIRQLSQDCPLILCTGYSESISEKTVSDWGNAAYLLKPIDTRKLLTLVHQMTSSRGDGTAVRKA